MSNALNFYVTKTIVSSQNPVHSVVIFLLI